MASDMGDDYSWVKFIPVLFGIRRPGAREAANITEGNPDKEGKLRKEVE